MSSNLSDNNSGLYLKDNAQTLSAYASATPNESPSKKAGTVISDKMFLQDIAQSHHFTVQLEGFDMLKTPGATFSEFLPVKSINFNYTSYENMSIPLAIFGDFPLLNKKRVSTIALTCFDLDDNRIERELLNWEDECFPRGRYVAYMDDIARRFTYKGYDVKGKETLSCYFYTIPSGNVSVGRDYSANDAKLIIFTLVCVGDGSTCATGGGKVKEGDISRVVKAGEKL